MINREFYKKHRFVYGPMLDFGEQCEQFYLLEGMVCLLLNWFETEIKEGAEVDPDSVLAVIERCYGVGYSKSKWYANTLWRLFRDKVRPLYRLVSPDFAPLEVKGMFARAVSEE